MISKIKSILVNWYKNLKGLEFYLFHFLSLLVIGLAAVVLLDSSFIFFILSIISVTCLIWLSLFFKKFRIKIGLGNLMTIISIIIALTVFSFGEVQKNRLRVELMNALNIEKILNRDVAKLLSERKDNDSYLLNRFTTNLSWQNIGQIISSLATQDQTCINSYLVFLRNVDAANVYIDGLIEIDRSSASTFSVIQENQYSDLWDKYYSNLIRIASDSFSELNNFDNNKCKLR
jgi:hypothetical protein